MQVNDRTILTAGAIGGTAAFATGTIAGVRGAGRRYAEADLHVRKFTNPDAGPTSAADSRRMARAAASAAARGADALTNPSVPFNLDAPGMRSADAIGRGAKLGAMTGAAILAGAGIAALVTRD